jgi:hypothetical protein
VNFILWGREERRSTRLLGAAAREFGHGALLALLPWKGQAFC